MHLRATQFGWEVWSPAKLNLFLEVRARRPDGFHEIETLMCPIALYDRVAVTLRNAAPHKPTSYRGIRVQCDWSAGNRTATREPLPQNEANTVGQALRALSQAVGEDLPVTARVVKRIPAGAGLGGGSGNAAAALLAVNRLCNLNLPLPRLAEIAARVGSDVPFFLYGGWAVCRGRGEIIEPLKGMGRLHAVVVKPSFGLSTAEVYRNCRPPRNAQTSRTACSALRSGNWQVLREGIFNRLQAAAASLNDWIERARWTFERLGCAAHQMSGSGSCYFGLCRNRWDARRLAALVQARLRAQVFAVESEA